jgi:hypothetical protein
MIKWYTQYSRADLIIANFLPSLMLGFMFSLNIGLHGLWLLSWIHIFAFLVWGSIMYVELGSGKLLLDFDILTCAGAKHTATTYLIFMGAYFLECLLIGVVMSSK